MHRISLAAALAAVVAAAGCGSGSTPDSAAPVVEGSFKVTVQDGLASGAALAVIGGRVTSSPDGIDCGAGVTTQRCEATFPASTTVVLTATPVGNDARQAPALANQFFGWKGTCSGLDTCKLAGKGDKYVVAEFGGRRTGHAVWTDAALHGPKYDDFAAGKATAVRCTECHGASLQGQGGATSCGQCHRTPNVPAAATQKVAETCAACHANGAKANHAMKGVVTASAGTVTAVGADLRFDVTVKVDDVPYDNMLGNTPAVYRHSELSGTAPAAVAANFQRDQLTAGTGYTIAAQGSGVYRVTIVGGVALVGATQSTFLVRLGDKPAVSGNYPADTVWATAVTNYNGLARDLVGNLACINCHGAQVFREREANGEWHHGANPNGVSACVVCHARATSVSRSAGGDRLTAYVHGIHNSGEMPARNIAATVSGTPYTVAKPAGVYARNDSIAVTNGVASISSPWKIGFPGYMVNCSVCHDTPARLNAVMAKPVTFSTCMSCHDDWDGFPTFVNTSSTTDKYDAKVLANSDWPAIVTAHRALTRPAAGTATANSCATSSCHNGAATAVVSGVVSGGFATVGDVHKLRVTERNGLVFGGSDQSIEQGKRIVMTISSVDPTTTPGSIIVKWGATLDGSAVDPCNTTVTTAAPIFHAGGAASTATGQAASNMSFLLGFAQGDDWVNPGVGTSPGQPAGSTNVVQTTNTICASKVATTTFTLPTGIPAGVTKALVALQGKPQIKFDGTGVNPGQASPDSRVIQVRSETPTYAFTLSSGAAATPRRAIVSNEKCLACHLGSLYQHGGNRIDNVALCAICHNPAANEKNNRVAMGVGATTAYDGKPGESYDLRNMIHAIHSAGERDGAYVIYRSSGVYAFGSETAIAALPHWPGAGTNKVYGAGSNDPTRPHNEIVVHYPRALNDCSACHVGDSEQNIGDQAKQMAMTVDAGAVQAYTNAVTPVYTGAANANQTDDVLMGATAASCRSCHRSDTQKAFLIGHTASFGWVPQTFTNARQTLVDYVTP